MEKNRKQIAFHARCHKIDTFTRVAWALKQSSRKRKKKLSENSTPSVYNCMSMCFVPCAYAAHTRPIEDDAVCIFDGILTKRRHFWMSERRHTIQSQRLWLFFYLFVFFFSARVAASDHVIVVFVLSGEWHKCAMAPFARCTVSCVCVSVDRAFVLSISWNGILDFISIRWLYRMMHVCLNRIKFFFIYFIHLRYVPLQMRQNWTIQQMWQMTTYVNTQSYFSDRRRNSGAHKPKETRQVAGAAEKKNVKTRNSGARREKKIE